MALEMSILPSVDYNTCDYGIFFLDADFLVVSEPQPTLDFF